MDALEDIGFYCVDNMPPKLLPKFAELCMQSQNKLSKVAIVMDVRGGELFNDLFDGLDDLKRQCGDYKILFLECDDQVLARRYKGKPGGSIRWPRRTITRSSKRSPPSACF